jgi:hypothetical protein
MAPNGERSRTTSGRSQLQRTGPIGRGARLVLALVVGAFVALRLATFVAKGPAGYRDPSILGDASLWILTAIVVFSVIDFAGRFAPGLEGVTPTARRTMATTALAVLTVAAAAIGLALHGSVWGFPLADAWWWLNTTYLSQLTVAFVPWPPSSARQAASRVYGGSCCTAESEGASTRRSRASSVCTSSTGGRRRGPADRMPQPDSACERIG